MFCLPLAQINLRDNLSACLPVRCTQAGVYAPGRCDEELLACARHAGRWRLCGKVDVYLKFKRGDGLKKGGRYFQRSLRNRFLLWRGDNKNGARNFSKVIGDR